MSKQLAFAAVGTFAMLLASTAFAASETGAMEPYSAPDPVYTPHKVVSSVDMQAPKDHTSLTAQEWTVEHAR